MEIISTTSQAAARQHDPYKYDVNDHPHAVSLWLKVHTTPLIGLRVRAKHQWRL
jgi:hypothetical protein